MLLFGLAAGVFLDRRKKLGRTLIGADLVRAGAFAFLAYAVGTSWMSSGIILVTAFLVGSMAVLFDSGLQSYMTQSLADNDLIRANSRLALARTLTLSVGPLVGGVIVTVGGGFAAAFMLNAATFVVSAIFLGFVRPVKAIPPRTHEPFSKAIRTSSSSRSRRCWCCSWPRRFSASKRLVMYSHRRGPP
jgi:MFS family permease